MNKNFNTRKIAVTGVVSAIYAVLTIMLSPLSFEAVQIRFSEVMVLLCYIDPIYSYGLILGCGIANCFSPLGVLDIVFGTGATIFSVYMITRTKSLFVATLWPTASSFIIAIGLSLAFNTPYLFNTLTVMIGEFVVVTLIGYPVFKYILKNDSLRSILTLSK